MTCNNQDAESNKQASLVTVIIPVYNGEKYIKQAINSVIAQSYENWELIIIDDGSTDSSSEIIEKFAQTDHRIKIFKQQNSGQSASRNFAASMAGGKYIAFFDQDDYFTKDHLKYLAKYLDRHDEIGMAYNDAEVVNELGDHMYNQGASPFPPESSPPNQFLNVSATI